MGYRTRLGIAGSLILVGLVIQLAWQSTDVGPLLALSAPFLLAGKGKNRIPVGARVFVRFPDGPEDFLGLQFQVALNTVQGTNYPYLYAVLIAEQSFGLLRPALGRLRPILRAGRDENLNVRGAWLHVLTDALGSVGAMVAGALIWALGWNWVDPAISTLIGLLVIYSAWRLVMESVLVLMESAPRGIDVDEVRQTIAGMPGVIGVHDLHVWTITSGLDSLSAHVVADEAGSHADLLKRLRRTLHERFGIDHITIQIEPDDFDERPTPV